MKLSEAKVGQYIVEIGHCFETSYKITINQWHITKINTKSVTCNGYKIIKEKELEDYISIDKSKAIIDTVCSIITAQTNKVSDLKHLLVTLPDVIKLLPKNYVSINTEAIEKDIKDCINNVNETMNKILEEVKKELEK